MRQGGRRCLAEQARTVGSARWRLPLSSEVGWAVRPPQKRPLSGTRTSHTTHTFPRPPTGKGDLPASFHKHTLV